jgi:hypothetical protein
MNSCISDAKSSCVDFRKRSQGAQGISFGGELAANTAIERNAFGQSLAKAYHPFNAFSEFPWARYEQDRVVCDFLRRRMFTIG